MVTDNKGPSFNWLGHVAIIFSFIPSSLDMVQFILTFCIMDIVIHSL